MATPTSTDRNGADPEDGVLAGYDETPHPLGEYGLLIATFGTLFSVGLTVAARAGRLPDRVRPSDVVLGALATQKLSRLVAKDRVTSAVRAPFTRREGEAGSAEVEEAPRGRGLRRTIGELLVCPFCLAQWVGAAFTIGLLLAPRPTRVIAGMMATVGLSDFLQVAYKAAENRRDRQ